MDFNLLAKFGILLIFPRFNKTKGIGQIVAWSVRNETLHCASVIKLFRTFFAEFLEFWKKISSSRCTKLERSSSSTGMPSSILPSNWSPSRVSRSTPSKSISIKSPTDAARNLGYNQLPHRGICLALARRHSQRYQANQFFRETRHRIFLPATRRICEEAFD